MNMAELTKVLTKLPFNYKVLPAHEVQSQFWEGRLFLIHPSATPIYYDQGDWHELIFFDKPVEA